jgi:peptidylprolyl isomerase
VAITLRFHPIKTCEARMTANRTKPEIDFPGEAAPTELIIDDSIVGEGPEATPGSTISAHYVGVAHSTGEEFDASWNRGAPLSFQLGVGQVIAGWDQGISGMRVGGRRTLTIPPHLGYGDRGAGGAIKGGETLIFVVDLMAVS